MACNRRGGLRGSWVLGGDRRWCGRVGCLKKGKIDGDLEAARVLKDFPASRRGEADSNLKKSDRAQAAVCAVYLGQRLFGSRTGKPVGHVCAWEGLASALRGGENVKPGISAGLNDTHHPRIGSNRNCTEEKETDRHLSV